MSYSSLSGPEGIHSVHAESDYVAPHFAKLLGQQMQLAVSLQDIGVTVKLYDPRLPSVSRWSCTMPLLQETPMPGTVLATVETKVCARVDMDSPNPFEPLGSSAVANAAQAECKSFASVLRKDDASKERKPNRRVSFRNFVQTMSPQAAKGFEVLKDACDSGMIQCAAEHSTLEIDGPSNHLGKHRDAAVMQSMNPCMRNNPKEGSDKCHSTTCEGEGIILELDKLIVPDCKYSVGVSHDMLEKLLAGHLLQELDRAKNLLRDMPEEVKRDLQCCVEFDPSVHELLSLRIYTDGTFFEKTKTGAWAIAVFGLCNEGRCWLGMASGLCNDKGQNETGGATSAFVPECMAILRALVLALNEICPACVHFDCTSAADTARLVSATDNSVAQATAAVLHLAALQNVAIDFKHEKAHTGVPGNEMVDKLAKRAAKGFEHNFPNDAVPQMVADGTIPWLWMALPGIPSMCQWPYMRNSSCTFVGSAAKKREQCAGQDRIADDTPVVNFSPNSHELPIRKTGHCEPGLSALNMLTYNALSLRSIVDQAAVEDMLVANCVHVAGFQETRDIADEITDTARYRKVHAAGEAGNFGCQVWIRKKSPWRVDTVAVRCREPRMLCVMANFGNVRCAIIVAHAPHSKQPDECVDEFWERLRQVVGSCGEGVFPILLLDANARYSADDRCTPENRNACQLDMCAQDYDLIMSRHFDCQGRQVHTWTGLSDRPAKLDYILVASTWVPTFVTKGLPEKAEPFAERDHRPLLATVRVPTARVESRGRLKLDRRAMSLPDNRQVVQQIFRKVPPCPWHMDVDEHLSIVHKHLGQQLEVAFPQQPLRIKQPYISEETWVLVRERRACRQVVRCLHKAWRKELLYFLFRAWIACVDSTALGHVTLVKRDPGVPNGHRKRITATMHGKRIAAINSELKAQMAKDKAEYVRQAFEEARGLGPDKMAALIRGVTKQGRRFRPPQTAPVLKMPDGSWQSDPGITQELLGDHFGKAERAVKMNEQLAENEITVVESFQPDQIQNWQFLPSIVELAEAFKAMQKGKATGISGLPSEAFRQAPIDAAQLYYPILMKMVVGGMAPQAWRKVLVVPIPKIGKQPGTVGAWRSIALQETEMKGIAAAVRAKLMKFVAPHFRPGQGGSRSGSTLDIPLAITKSHVRKLWQTGKSGAILFIDGASAFYAAVREFLFDSMANLNDQERLTKLVELLHPSEQVRQEIFAILIGPSVLEQAELPSILRRFVATTLSGTYFTMNAQSNTVWVTRTGVTPGVPLADAYFQAIFIQSLKEIELRLGHLHGGPRECAGRNTEQPEVPMATWIDDVALLAEVEDPTCLVELVRETVVHAQASLAYIGIDTNFGENKTEVMLVFVGKRGRSQKEKWLSPQNPTLDVELLDGRNVQVVITSQYQHVGSIVEYNGSDLSDLSRKSMLARNVFGALCKRILFNPHLNHDEKRSLVKSMVGRKLLQGAGHWALKTQKELRKFHASYMRHWRSCGRPLLGISFAGALDAEVCAMLGVLEPLEALAVERVRTLVHVVRDGPDFLLQVLVSDRSWMPLVADDFRMVVEGSQADVVMPGAEACEDWSQLLGCFKAQTDEIKKALKMYQSRTLRARDELAKSCINKARWRMHAKDMAIAICHLPQSELESQFPCRTCGQLFQSAAAVASHMSRVHAQGSALRKIRGTACEVCMKEYFSTERLHLHLRKSQTCKLVYLESDVCVDGPCVKGSFRAWQPATKVQGPVNFWAHLRPDAQAECDDNTQGDVHVRVILSLAQMCPVPFEAGQVAVFTKRFFKGLESLMVCCSCEPSDLRMCTEDLPLGTPHFPIVNDIVNCFERFSDSLCGCFEGEAWCFRWKGRTLLVAPRGTCLTEEFLCL